jgi:hypothetical protein
MTAQLDDIGRYDFGWHDKDTAGANARRGLNEEVVRDISAKKNEPSWMLDLRLKGGCDQAPQAEELAALTKRPEDPLIARVAQELQARLTSQEGMDGEAAAVSRAALCELFRLATSP